MIVHPLKHRVAIALLGAVCMASAADVVHAQTDGSKLDKTKPVYVEGFVRTTSWMNPRAAVLIDVNADLALPADLVQRNLSASAPQNNEARAAWAKAVLPDDPRGAWLIDMAPLPRMEAAGFAAPIRVGQRVGAIGIPSYERGKKTLRADYLFVDGKAASLRPSSR